MNLVSDMAPRRGLVALVYEITNNPHFDPRLRAAGESISTLVRPGEIDRLIGAFKANGHTVTVVDGPAELLSRAPELATSARYIFNKSVGFAGLERKVVVPAVCYVHGLRLVGSGAYAMTLARHKYHTNRLLAGAGYRVPAAALWAADADSVRLRSLSYPAIVKPNQESECLGISADSVVGNEQEAVRQARKIVSAFDQPAIIEEFIPGEELKVPVIGNGVAAKGFGCVGVMKGGQPITGSLQTRDDLLADRISYYDVPVSAFIEKIQVVATAIHGLLGLHDYSRVDFRLDAHGEPVCMEVSTHPDLTEDCSFVRACSRTVGDYDRVVNVILDAADKRFPTLGHPVNL